MDSKFLLIGALILFFLFGRKKAAAFVPMVEKQKDKPKDLDLPGGGDFGGGGSTDSWLTEKRMPTSLMPLDSPVNYNFRDSEKEVLYTRKESFFIPDPVIPNNRGFDSVVPKEVNSGAVFLGIPLVDIERVPVVSSGVVRSKVVEYSKPIRSNKFAFPSEFICDGDDCN